MTFKHFNIAVLGVALFVIMTTGAWAQSNAD